jgi:type I site-specific restriction endonuclease
LLQAGWSVQDRSQINLVEHLGVAVRETTLSVEAGRADYILYVDRRMLGVIEAKLFSWSSWNTLRISLPKYGKSWIG